MTDLVGDVERDVEVGGAVEREREPPVRARLGAVRLGGHLADGRARVEIGVEDEELVDVPEHLHGGGGHDDGPQLAVALADRPGGVGGRQHPAVHDVEALQLRAAAETAEIRAERVARQDVRRGRRVVGDQAGVVEVQRARGRRSRPSRECRSWATGRSASVSPVGFGAVTVGVGRPTGRSAVTGGRTVPLRSTRAMAPCTTRATTDSATTATSSPDPRGCQGPCPPGATTCAGYPQPCVCSADCAARRAGTRAEATVRACRWTTRRSATTCARFATTRRGVEAYVEPATNVTAESIVLVATDGEWTRRAVGSRKAAFELARSLDIPVYDVLLTGYPKRMREWSSRQRRGQA